MRKQISALIAAALFVFPLPASAMGQAAKALIQEFKIPTYTATRKADNVYELLEGYVVITQYCYAYTYGSTVVVTQNKIIFVDDNEVCDVKGVYRK
jgi:hypothetical protein